MKKLFLNKFSSKILIVFLLLGVTIYASFAENRDIISPRLREKAKQQQQILTKSLSSSSSEAYIRVLFYPEGKNSDNIDVSFFISNNIDYKKSRSFMVASVPVHLIEKLEEIQGVIYIDISEDVQLMETITEGRDCIKATKFVLDNIAGEGVKIAIIDEGFAGYDKLQQKGELPVAQNLITKDFTRTPPSEIDPTLETEKHGSGCAEIIYDIVPKAKMYLLKIKEKTDFDGAYTYCTSEGIDIVSASLGWSFSGCFMDGTSEIDEIVDARSKNILSVFAVGNEGNTSWFGSFQDDGTGEKYTKFPSGRNYLEVNVPLSVKIHFIWNDFRNSPYQDFSISDYSLYVYDQNGVLIRSYPHVSGSPPHIEFVNETSQTKLRFKIQKTKDTESGREMRLFYSTTEGRYRNQPFVVNEADRNPESSLCTPADSRTVLAVGAMNCSNYDNGLIESFSSRGPTRPSKKTKIKYNLDFMTKPDIVAPDGVSTLSYGVRAFSGTSAATPHIAGAAAILLSLDPTLSKNIPKFKNYVISYATQIQSSPDNTYGNGKLILNSEIIPHNNVGDFVCYPNPASISERGYIKITNFPFNTSVIDVVVYTVTGEFVKSFNADDLEEDVSINKRMIKWNLKNQDGSQIAPGVYFISIKTLLGGKHIKKIAIFK
ncbi:MAG: S8 family serine peptidase [Endomicrobium sp.]|jgi:subtilisin family serine protease|nr:S8 family serine peptidase [Endomicrobium sp.]